MVEQQRFKAFGEIFCKLANSQRAFDLDDFCMVIFMDGLDLLKLSGLYFHVLLITNILYFSYDHASFQTLNGLSSRSFPRIQKKRESASSAFQTLRSGLKKRGAAECSYPTSRCLEIRWHSFSIA